MKYVKLFESWLNSVNEKLSTDNLNKLTTLAGYADDEDYTKSPESFAKHIVKTIQSMFANAPEGYKIKLDYKLKIKEIILSTKIGENTNTFQFEFDRKTFTPVEIRATPSLLGIKGKATVGNKFVDQTTLAQFIYSNLTANDIKNYDMNSDDYENTIEELLSISSGKKPAVLSGKSGKKNISKMTAGEFYSLPSQKKIKLFNIILDKKFKVLGTRGDLVYVVAPTQELASKYKMQFDTSTSYMGGRYLTFQFTNQKPEDEDASIADIPVIWGESNLKSDYSQEIYDPKEANKVDKVYVDSATKTTLAAFLLALLDLEKNGMAYGKGEKVDTQIALFSKDAIKADDSDATKKKASDAWKKEGGSADMTLGTSEPKGEATA